MFIYIKTLELHPEHGMSLIRSLMEGTTRMSRDHLIHCYACFTFSLPLFWLYPAGRKVFIKSLLRHGMFWKQIRLVFWLYHWCLRWSRICLQCWRPGFDPWVGKIPCRREWQPTPVFLPGEFNGQGSLAGYSPWGRKELVKTKRFTLVTSTGGGESLTSPVFPLSWGAQGLF